MAIGQQLWSPTHGQWLHSPTHGHWSTSLEPNSWPMAIGFIAQLMPPRPTDTHTHTHTHIYTQGAGLTPRGGVAISRGAWFAHPGCKSGRCQWCKQGGAASRAEPQPRAWPDWLGGGGEGSAPR